MTSTCSLIEHTQYTQYTQNLIVYALVLFSYIDRYRDVKDLAEEAIKERLKISSPFEPLPPVDPFGNIRTSRPTDPTWLTRKEALKWRRVGYFKDINVELD